MLQAKEFGEVARIHPILAMTRFPAPAKERTESKK